MLIDNEPDIATVLSKGLARYDFTVTTYTDPVQALADFKPGIYMAVLIDYRMPAMDGIMLYQKLFVLDDKPKYIIMTAGDCKPTVSLTRNVQVIYKPVTIAKLVLQIQNMLSEA